MSNLYYEYSPYHIELLVLWSAFYHVSLFVNPWFAYNSSHDLLGLDLNIIVLFYQSCFAVFLKKKMFPCLDNAEPAVIKNPEEPTYSTMEHNSEKPLICILDKKGNALLVSLESFSPTGHFYTYRLT